MNKNERLNPNNNETLSPVVLSYEEYYSREGLPTPFDPSVYGSDFNGKLRRDLLSETTDQIVDQVDVMYPYRDAVMRAVLNEVDYQLSHRSEHNAQRLDKLNELLSTNEDLANDCILDNIIKKMNYGSHDAAEAGYVLSKMPEDFDGLEVKKYTQFGMTRSKFHLEAFKTIGALHRATHYKPELGMSEVDSKKSATEDYKQIETNGVAPICIFKQTLAEFEQNNVKLELVTRGSFVPLPDFKNSGVMSHKIISLQQYVRRYNPEQSHRRATHGMSTIALANSDNNR